MRLQADGEKDHTIGLEPTLSSRLSPGVILLSGTPGHVTLSLSCGVATGIWKGKARDAARHPTKHRTAPAQGMIQPRMSLVLEVESHHGLTEHGTSGSLRLWTSPWRVTSITGCKTRRPKGCGWLHTNVSQCRDANEGDGYSQWPVNRPFTPPISFSAYPAVSLSALHPSPLFKNLVCCLVT